MKTLKRPTQAVSLNVERCAAGRTHPRGEHDNLSWLCSGDPTSDYALYAPPRARTVTTVIILIDWLMRNRTLQSPTRSRHSSEIPRSCLTSPSGSFLIAAASRSRSVRPSRLSVFNAAGRISIDQAAGSVSQDFPLGLIPGNARGGVAERLGDCSPLGRSLWLVVVGRRNQLRQRRVLSASQEYRRRIEGGIRESINKLVKLRLGHDFKSNTEVIGQSHVHSQCVSKARSPEGLR